MKTETEFGYILERFLDDYMGKLCDGGSVRKPNFESAIKSYKPTKREIKFLRDHFVEVRAEITGAINKTDIDLVEGYSFLNVTKLKKLDDYLESLIDVLEAKSKITRKKKKVNPAKLVQSVQYLPESKEFELESVNPVGIVGAKGLLCFNTKTKKLTLFEANTSDGLSIKGTTVQGFSEDSITKTIRKNNYNIFSLITEGRIVHTKGVMTKVKTKNSTPTGRINKDTLILRTYLQ
jgi:hypothetical protein|tara:strand:- start:176 stop:880 length:705 start_codon:yes stop_codon:yes gene_type:complete